MKNVRVDGDGEFRCWNCGNKGLLAKRTFRSKVLVGVGALLTKKKLKCQTCGEFNDAGNAQPFDGPESRKWRKRYEKEQKAKSVAAIEAETRAAQIAAAAIAAEFAAAEAGQAPSALEAPVPVSSPQGETDPVEQIKKLGELKDAGLMSEDEFIEKRNELLGRM